MIEFLTLKQIISMKVDVSKQPKNVVKVTVELDQADLQPYLKSAAARLSQKVDVPGFRPGKAPYDMIKKQVGEQAIYQEASEDIVKKTYPQIVIDQKLEAIGRPQIELQKVAPGNSFVYVATVALLPSVKLGDYKKLKARKKDVKVDPKELEKTLQHLRKMRAKETAVDRPAQKGDKVEIDVDLSMDNVPVEGGATKNHPVVIGENQMVPGFEDNLVGMKKGETKEFQQPYPKEYFQKNLAGKDVDCKVKVNNVLEVELPELNDAFVKTLGKFENVEALKMQVSKNIEAEQAQKEKQKFEIAMLDEIIQKSEFGEIPEVLIQAELVRMVGELRMEIERQGLNFNDYMTHLKKTEDDFKKEFHPQAERRIKSALILRQIRIQEDIKVDHKKIEDDIKHQKELYKDDLETYNKVDSPEYRDQYEEMLLNRQVFDFLEQQIYPDKK